MSDKFNGRSGKLGDIWLELDSYDSAIDSNGYIFKSFRSHLSFEFEMPLTSHCKPQYFGWKQSQK